MNRLVTLSEAAELIGAGIPLAIAGPESALDALPAGDWIAGTTPYFMDAAGGVVVTDDRVFVTPLPTEGAVRFVHYGVDELPRLVADAPENGFSVAIVPARSPAHRAFAEHATDDAAAFLKPTVGWVAGVHLSDLATVSPRVFLGVDATSHEDGVVVAHVALPESQLATIEIVNIFEPGHGDVLRFPETTFEVGQCLVDGTPTSFAAYLEGRGLADGKLPLVGDFGGALLNVSLQSVDVARDRVALYAPVFPGVDYRFARPVEDYAQRFRERLSDFETSGVRFSCNCVLNFLFGGLEGESLGEMYGPVTFGEIGYQLLNQTLVVLRVR